MSYLTEIAKDTVKSHFFIKITPRLSVTGFTNYSGNVYRVAYTTGYVTKVGSLTVRKNSVAELSGNTHFYQDIANGYLYIYSSTAVTSGDAYVTKFELYFSTRAGVWYRVPTDDTTDEVEWEANISRPPEITYALGDQSYGIAVIDASSFSVFYSPEKHQYAVATASFRNCPVEIYHLAGDLRVANFENAFSGYLDQKFYLDFQQINFDIIQKNFERYGAIQTGTGLGGTGDPALNTNSQQIRALLGSLGVHDDDSGRNIRAGVRPWNARYDDTTPTTSNNRVWVLGWDLGLGFHGTLDGVSVSPSAPTGSGFTYFGDSGAWVPALKNLGTDPSPAYPSTPNKYKRADFDLTYSSDFLRFAVGDHVRVRNTTTATTYFTTVTEIPVAGDLKFNDDVGSGDVEVSKYMVDELFLIQNNVIYDLKPERDFSVAHNGSGNSAPRLEITLTSSAESNVSASTINPANGDYLLATVKSFGMMRATYESGFNSNNKANGLVGRIYNYLTRALQFAQTDINMDSFETAIASDTTDDGGDYVGDDSTWSQKIQPLTSSQAPPNHSEILKNYLVSARCILYYGEDNLLTIKKIGTGTAVATINLEEDAIRDSIRVSYDFSDLDNVVYPVEDSEESGLLGSSTSFREVQPYTTVNISDPDDGGADTELHDIQNPRKVDAKPTTLRATRKGQISFKTNLALSLENVGSTVTLRSKYLPGFAYDGETIHEDDYMIYEIKKTIDGVELVLDS